MSGTVIKVTCTECLEESELGPAAVLLTTWAPGVAVYEFTCPRCDHDCRKPADEGAVALLRPCVVRNNVPRPREADEQHTGPALTEDDLIRFGLALEAGAMGEKA
jgi:hypothetical protein